MSGIIIDMSSRFGGAEFEVANLQSRIRSAETGERVNEGFRQILDVDIVPKFSFDGHLATSKEPPEEGVCDIKFIKPMGITVLIADIEFARYLYENGMPAPAAIDVAALYARALFHIARITASVPGAERLVQDIQTPLPLKPRYWPADEATGHTLSEIMSHRTAAALALEYTSQTFDTRSAPPYPAHIAALMNPLR